ncbi:long-chain fatty acid--CoA ligase [Paenibacillus oenotherae]|uniref:Long-chain fatty acid--CoA ligase n=1 Tax=Paenibacillus oenotherae TaxID=1435645 RepID=A0ABS7DDR0_9BACL|nr:long-chain fatty acid--CoA ligase [Paenibacillus oenotherae]MBW7477308.1 long-chain fatty acid--CoA ligase [Paenibacillus oenotherae]
MHPQSISLTAPYTSPAVRRELIADTALGSGNFLDYAIQASPDPDAALIHLQQPFRLIDGSVHEAFSLHALREAADLYSAWYYSQGVRAREPIAYQFDDGAAYLIHYLALTRIGAIAVPVNSHLRPEIVSEYIQYVRVKGFFSDSVRLARVQKLLGGNSNLRFAVSDETAAPFGMGELPGQFPYKHYDTDPVAIFHSSGTTGLPKAVCAEHQQLFYTVRHRLKSARPEDRYLSAMISSHSAFVQFNMLYLLQGCPIMLLSELMGVKVLESAEKFRPTLVAAFNQTYTSIAKLEMSKYDLYSIELWFNTGDAAHEEHIREIVKHGSTMRGGSRVDGSWFVDALGSTELASFLMTKVYTVNATNYNRCVGFPVDYVDAAVISDEGDILPDMEVGMLGMKSPTINERGYWNSSDVTYSSRVQGYFLTGDMVYRDRDGMFYQVDRTPDVIRTPEGNVYSLVYEELLIKRIGDIVDCTVVGAGTGGNRGQEPIAIVQLAERSGACASAMLEDFNAYLQETGRHRLAALLIATEPEDIPLGATGKVLKRVLRDKHRDLLTDRGLQAEYVRNGRGSFWGPEREESAAGERVEPA